MGEQRHIKMLRRQAKKETTKMAAQWWTEILTQSFATRAKIAWMILTYRVKKGR